MTSGFVLLDKVVLTSASTQVKCNLGSCDINMCGMIVHLAAKLSDDVLVVGSVLVVQCLQMSCLEGQPYLINMPASAVDRDP
jgi:hypothetical protein